mmetsp:Transcript_60882/g.139583  ORF Transcript_60882/g.139583 Transcript_60882/m.139583 type:complete len:223 (-) Transcript_60882:173-841(-)
MMLRRWLRNVDDHTACASRAVCSRAVGSDRCSKRCGLLKNRSTQWRAQLEDGAWCLRWRHHAIPVRGAARAAGTAATRALALVRWRGHLLPAVKHHAHILRACLQHSLEAAHRIVQLHPELLDDANRMFCMLRRQAARHWQRGRLQLCELAVQSGDVLLNHKRELVDLFGGVGEEQQRVGLGELCQFRQLVSSQVNVVADARGGSSKIGALLWPARLRDLLL